MTRMAPPSSGQPRSPHSLAPAKRALNGGNVALAMRCAAQVLLDSPFRSEAFALIDEIIAYAEDPLALAPLQPGQSELALALARVKVLFGIGRPEEALELWCALLPVAPADPLFQVLKRAVVAGLSVGVSLPNWRNTVRALVRHAAALPVPAVLDDRRLSQVEAAAVVLACLRGEFQSAAELYSAEVAIRRKLLRTSDTLALAQLGAERFPDDWRCLTALANALADAGRAEEGLLYARRACALLRAEGSRAQSERSRLCPTHPVSVVA